MTSRNYCWTINNPTDVDYAHIESLKEKCSYLIFGREKGEEKDTPHLQGYHVLKSPARFAAQSRLLPRAHLEVRKGTHKQAQDYCKKEGDYEEYSTKEEKTQSNKAFAYIADCESYEEACIAVELHNPRDWFINGDKIRQNLKRKFVPQYPLYNPIFEVKAFKPCPQLENWVNSWTVSRTPCLFLIGPTKLGKTAWARSIIQPHTYWKSMVNIDDFNPASKLLIFDDFDWEYMPNPKGWLTQAGECTISDKYRHKMTINVNMPAIYICNDHPQMTLSDAKYWASNSVVITINKPLY